MQIVERRWQRKNKVRSSGRELGITSIYAVARKGRRIAKILKIEASASSVNGGIPFPASGVVANSRNAVAGYLTTGPELVFLTRALKV